MRSILLTCIFILTNEAQSGATPFHIKSFFSKRLKSKVSCRFLIVSREYVFQQKKQKALALYAKEPLKISPSASADLTVSLLPLYLNVLFYVTALVSIIGRVLDC